MSGLLRTKTVELDGGGGDASADRLFLSESEVINLILEYLGSRKLTGSQLEVEKETGVINEPLMSPDLIFLRTLILEGRWEDVLEFLQPLEEAFRSFPGKKVREVIFKYSFLDKMLTAHRSQTMSEESKSLILEELVKILSELESVCEGKDEYSSLCLLLTSPSRLSEHPEYREWSSSTARLSAFTLLLPLVSKYIPPPPGPLKVNKISTNDRLIQLLIKGLLYETCVDFCQSRALKESSPLPTRKNVAKSNTVSGPDLRFSTLLSESQLSESDLSLISWLRSIPPTTFSCPFQRRVLRVDVEPLPPPIQPKLLLNVSIIESASDLLSRSMASTSFHLSGIEAGGGSNELKTMTTSVDRLFGDMAIDSFHQALTKETKLLSTPQGQIRTPQNNISSSIPLPINSKNLATQKQLQRNNVTSSQQQRINSSSEKNSMPESGNASEGGEKAKFISVTMLEDVQAVRCAEFHPSGRVYAIGSNSKTLRLCEYPNLSKISENHVAYQPTVLFKRTKHHKGSIYCMGWSPDGSILATGSNDKTVKLLRFEDMSNPELSGSSEVELSMHDGTVRDLCFIEETSNKSSLLVSGGAGDCKIYVTDCHTSTPFQALSGHTGPILSLFNWGSATFCSGSQDKTVRFWDLRTRGCVDVITPLTSSASTKSPVASVSVEPSGRLLVSGAEDGATVLYDVRGMRQVQAMKAHSADVRSVRYSPAAYYLLSGGYDNRLVLTDLQGDLSLPLPSVVVASHEDKVISGRWHPSEFSFLSASADKTAVLWALPPERQ